MNVQMSMLPQTPTEILAYECAARGVDVDDVITTELRTRELTATRWAVARRLRFMEHMSYPRIGRVLGMDHSSVRYACTR